MSASLLGLTEYLVETTHPNSLLMMGSSRRLHREMESQSKRWQACRLRIVDVCAGRLREEEHEERRGGAEEEDGGAWLLILAVAGTVPEEEETVFFPMYHRYVKHAGRWMFFGVESDGYPNQAPFSDFAEKHHKSWSAGDPDAAGSGAAEEDPKETARQTWKAKAGKQSDGSDWPYSFELVSPCYAPQGATEDELLGPWMWDDLAAADGQPPAPPRGQSYPRRRQLLYLDDYAPAAPAAAGSAALSAEEQQLLLDITGEDLSDDEGLSVRRAALINHRMRQQLSKLRNPKPVSKGPYQ